MYADNLTDSMRMAIHETNRRREKQVSYNEERGIDPQPLRKKIADITDQLAREGAQHGCAARRSRRRQAVADAEPAAQKDPARLERPNSSR